jgi:hypothetical protein
MKDQPKQSVLQLNLVLRNPVTTPLPDGKERELTQALAELLLSAASAREPLDAQARGGKDESKADS